MLKKLGSSLIKGRPVGQVALDSRGSVESRFMNKFDLLVIVYDGVGCRTEELVLHEAGELLI